MIMNTVNPMQQTETAQPVQGVVQADKGQSGTQGLFALLLAALSGNAAPDAAIASVPFTTEIGDLSGGDGQMPDETSGESVPAQIAAPVAGAVLPVAEGLPVPVLAPVDPLLGTMASNPGVVAVSNAGPVPVDSGMHEGSVDGSGMSTPVIGLAAELAVVAGENTAPVPVAGIGEPAGNVRVVPDAVITGTEATASGPEVSSTPQVVAPVPETSQDPAPLWFATHQPQSEGEAIPEMAVASAEVEAQTGQSRAQILRGQARPMSQPVVSGEGPSQPENKVVADAEVRVMPEVVARESGPETPVLRQTAAALHDSVPDAALKSVVVEQTHRETVHADPAVADAPRVAKTDEAQVASTTSTTPDKAATFATVANEFRARLDEAAAQDTGGGDADLGEAGLLAKAGTRPAVARPGQLSAPDQPASPRPAPLLDQVVSTVRTLQAGDRTEMRVRLNPPHLGEMQVRIVHEGDTLRVQIAADNGLARDLLQARLPELRNALADIRGTVSDLNVTVAAGEDAPSASLTTSNGGGRTADEQPSGRSHDTDQHAGDTDHRQEEMDHRRYRNMRAATEGHIDVHA